MGKRDNNSKEDLLEKKQSFEKIAANVEEIRSDKYLKENFLPYAWSFTLNRAISDVSGLKPVQKRIIYTMFKEGLRPDGSRQKVATLGGKVLALHPHGDTSVNDALKNLARDHVFRVPIIDGKGDFGAPGSPGAAPRYIEARLSKAGWINAEEISEKAIEMIPNYDSTTVEPLKLPVKWPISLINGTEGIAVGFASKIPSHNPNEIMKSLLLLLKNPDASDEKLLKIVQGPDFNMGGTITSNDGIKEYLTTGSGSFKIRGNYEIIPLPRGRTRIEFYEIPYGTYPEKIIEEIQLASLPVGTLKNNKKVAGAKGLFKDVSTYKDLSDLKHPIRVVIETKAGAQYQKVLLELFKNTSLETSFGTNITMIIDNKPVKTGMKTFLLDFIEFRKECVKNKTKYNLNKKENRLHLIDGLLKVLLDIDAAIKIIRNSENPEEAKNKLQKKFKIDESQALYVLKLQLQRLTKMDSLELKNEDKKLTEEVKELKELLTNESKLVEFLQKEFKETLKVIDSERKTIIIDGDSSDFIEHEKEQATQIEELNENKECYITRFSNGTLIKTIEKPFEYKVKTAKTIKNAPIVEEFKAMTEDKIVIVGDDGIGHRIPLSYLANDKIQTLKQIGISLNKNVKIVGIAKNETSKDEIGLAIGTKNGTVKISKTDFPVSFDEFPVISLDNGDKIVNCIWLDKDNKDTFFTFISSDSSILTFDASTIRVAGSKAGGVRGMKVKPDAEIISFNWIQNLSNAIVLSQTEKSLKMTPLSEVSPKGKGGQGMILQKLNKGENKLINSWAGINPILTVKGEKKIVQLPIMSKRATTGVSCPFPCDFGSINPIV